MEQWVPDVRSKGAAMIQGYVILSLNKVSLSIER